MKETHSNLKFLAISIFIVNLTIKCYLADSICKSASGCNRCRYFDVNHDKNLFAASCNRFNLTSIPVIVPQKQLGRLFIAFNNISEISPQVMKDYTFLKVLSLNANRITVIKNGSFKHNKFLEQLYISGNRIERLHKNNFQGLLHLTRLIMENNSIKFLKRATFEFVKGLTELSLRDNKISLMEDGAFEGLNALRTLVLGGNRLKMIQFDFSVHPALTFLDISYNKISEVGKKVFSNIPLLRTLHLNNNKLSDVPLDALRYIRNLTELDLSGNSLTFIAAETFMGFYELETLYLRFCNIAMIHMGFGDDLKSLKNIYLDGNPLICDCRTRWLKEWLTNSSVSNTKPLEEQKKANLTTHPLEEIKCNNPPRLKNMPVVHVKDEDFLCSCQTCYLDNSCYSTKNIGVPCPVWNCSEQLVSTCSSRCDLAGIEPICSHLNKTCYCSWTSRACGENADLQIRNTTRFCRCKQGFTGDALTECLAVYEESLVRTIAISIACLTAASCLIAAVLAWFRCRYRRRISSSEGCSLNWQNAIPFSSWISETATASKQVTIKTESIPSEPQKVTCGDKWEIPRDRLQIGEIIGEGEFGLVMKGILSTELGKMEVAIKTIKKKENEVGVYECILRDLTAELKILKKVGQHPNIVNLIGACTSIDGPLCVVTELVSGGDLLKYLRANRPRKSQEYVNISPPVCEKDMLEIALGVAEGMKHISGLALVHRDLAARNVLLTSKGKAKITDFGLSRSVYTEGIYHKTSQGRLPLKWMALESIEQFVFTTKSDVWSFGVLLWEIQTFGGFPYPEIPVGLLLPRLSAGYRLPKPSHCKDALYDVMLSCWNEDPDSRPDFGALTVTLRGMVIQAPDDYVNLCEQDVSGFVEYEIMDPSSSEAVLAI